MRTVRSAADCDVILQLPTTFTLGFSKTEARRLDQGKHVKLGEHAFGTPGMGGSQGSADGEAEMSFGYVMNRHGSGVGLNDRGQSLVDAAYRAVDFETSDLGFWVRSSKPAGGHGQTAPRSVRPSAGREEADDPGPAPTG